MLPGNVLSSTVLASPYLAPKDRAKHALVDYFLGGNAINDTSAGLNSQIWTATLDATKTVVSYSSPRTGTTVVMTAAAPMVWMTAAFDQSLRVIIAWTDVNGNSWFYWYDTTIVGYRTTALPAGTVQPFAALDDARIQENTVNDAIVAYTTATGHLVYRQQRDRFGVEYDLGLVPTTLTGDYTKLRQVGMNLKFRLQFEFMDPHGNIDVPPYEYSGVTQ
jgi:hypothetical protein